MFSLSFGCIARFPTGLSQGPCAYLVYTFALEGSGTKVVRIPCVCVHSGISINSLQAPSIFMGPTRANMDILDLQESISLPTLQPNPDS